MKKVAVVTGGSGGIGRAVASRAADEGYAVAVTYRSHPERAQVVIDEITAKGGAAMAFDVELTDDKSVTDFFKKVDDTLGPVTALVNNAGMVGWQHRVDEVTAAQLAGLWAINVTSYFICAREAIKRMSTLHGGQGGVIINMSSVAGLRGGREQRVHYAASKGAVNSFTVGLAKEVASEGIRVCAVLPGFINSEFHENFGGESRAEKYAPLIPMKRVGLPVEAAEAAIWLMSDKASFATATLLEVAGGS